MPDLFKDFTYTRNTVAIAAGDTVITAEDVTLFPTNVALAASTLYCCIESALTYPNTFEIVKVVSVDTTAKTLTVVRAQDGTTAQPHAINTYIKGTLTSNMLNRIVNSIPSTASGSGGLLTFTDFVLPSGVVDFGAPYPHPGWAVDNGGVVHLRGIVKPPSGVFAYNTVLATLPVTARPMNVRLFTAFGGSNVASGAYALATFAVNTDGTIVVQGSSGSFSNTSTLTSISFEGAVFDTGLPGIGGASGIPTPVYDTVTRPNSTSVPGSTEDSRHLAWRTDSGTWGVRNNALYTSSSTNEAILSVLLATSDFDARVGATAPSGTNNECDVVFRQNNTLNSGYVLVLNSTTGVWTLFRQSGTTYTTSATVNRTVTASTYHIIRIITKGDRIRVFEGDVMLFDFVETTAGYTVASPGSIGTRFGLRTYASTSGSLNTDTVHGFTNISIDDNLSSSFGVGNDYFAQAFMVGASPSFIAQTVPVNSFTRLLLTKTIDTFNLWDDTNHWYTVPVSGNYEVFTEYRLVDGQTVGSNFQIDANTSDADTSQWQTIAAATAAAANRVSGQHSEIRAYTAGQQIRVVAYMDSTTSLAITNTRITVRYLGAPVGNAAQKLHLVIARLPQNGTVSTSAVVQSFANNTFLRVSLLKSTDSENLWDDTNHWYTVPETGTYEITVEYRLQDGTPASGTGTPANMNYLFDSNTSEADSGIFQTTPNTTIGSTNRRTAEQRAVLRHYTTGQQIRCVTYFDTAQTSIDVLYASMSIRLIVAG